MSDRYARLAFLAAAAASAVGCATTESGGAMSASRQLLAYDDGRAEGVVAFPTTHFESIVRFALPAGQHKLLRLWFQPAGPGSYQLTIYDSTPLEAPGTAVHQIIREVPTTNVSDGKDNRWQVEDISAAGARGGVLWVGVKKAGGDSALWATPLDAGQYFIRSDDPGNRIEFMPVRRTPLLRLEIAP